MSSAVSNGPSGSIPLIFLRLAGPSMGPTWTETANDGALKAIFPDLTPKWALRQANQAPRDHPVCAYIGQSGCQARSLRKNRTSA